MTQWDFQNKGKSGWTGKSSFVLKVPLRHLRPSVIYSVPCDWILQMAYCASKTFSVCKPFLGAKEKSQFDKFASKRSVSVYRGFPSR